MITKDALIYLIESNEEMRDEHAEGSSPWSYHQGKVDAYIVVLSETRE